MPSLPDPNDSARQSQVQAKAQSYQWLHLVHPKPELARFMPLGSSGEGVLPEIDRPTERWQKNFDALVAEVDGVANAAVLLFGGYGTNPQGLLDMTKLYTKVPVPTSAEHYTQDDSFGAQRIAGAHPVVIKRVTEVNELLDKTAFRDEHLVNQVGVKLADAVGHGRLLLCDYNILADFTELSGTGTSSVVNTGIGLNLHAAVKYFEAPRALFYWEGQGYDGRMRPVAVQIERRINAEVITPHDAKRWPIAKLAVQSADAHVHELDSHALRCHFVLEAIKVAAERTFHNEHPLLILLRPHLRQLLAINDKIESFLFLEGDNIDQLLAPPLVEGSHGILEQARANYDFGELADFENEVSRRNLSDDQFGATIDYPYRDDGRLVWDAILAFTQAYVDHYYVNNTGAPDDGIVASDVELQHFAREVIRRDGGRIQGFPKVADRKSVAKMLAAIIWTSGPLHAALNFTQWDFFGFVANAPFALYSEFPGEGQGVPPFEAFLPNVHGAVRQTGLMYALSSYHYDMLGFYEEKDFDTRNDPGLEEIIHDFQCELGKINADIFRRNIERRFPYPYLMPLNVPNSTNV